jgi:hypothetical protein
VQDRTTFPSRWWRWRRYCSLLPAGMACFLIRHPWLSFLLWQQYLFIAVCTEYGVGVGVLSTLSLVPGTVTNTLLHFRTEYYYTECGVRSTEYMYR